MSCFKCCWPQSAEVKTILLNEVGVGGEGRRRFEEGRGGTGKGEGSGVEEGQGGVGGGVQAGLLAAPYVDYEALIESVNSGAVAPIRGSFILKLFKSGGKMKRRQDLPPEAFWTADQLREIIKSADAVADWGESSQLTETITRERALGWLFVALSYRWLGKGQPDPDGFHLELMANFLDSYVGEKEVSHRDEMVRVVSPLRTDLFDKIGFSKDEPIDCAIFWE